MEALILLVAMLITVATSKSTSNGTGVVTDSYGVSTTCPNATHNDLEIQVSAGQVTSPSGLSFLNFGLPVAVLGGYDNGTLSGEVAAGITRVCTVTESGGGGTTTSVYACSDNGTSVCQVSFTRL